MSNVNGPFGFRHVGRAQGAPPNFGLKTALMLSTQASALGFGDVVSLGTGGSAGYIIRYATSGAVGAQVAGIFVGCEYYSTAERRKVFDNYWPGSGATGNVTVKLVSDEFSRFMVQSADAAITQASVGKYANAVLTAPNSANHMSLESLDDTSINATKGSLPFVIDEIIQTPNSDPTSSYNLVMVRLCNTNPGI